MRKGRSVPVSPRPARSNWLSKTKSEACAGLKVVHCAKRIGIRAVEELCAAVIDHGIAAFQPHKRVRRRVVLEHSAKIDNEMRFVVEAQREVLAPKMNPAWTSFDEGTEPVEMLSCSNTQQYRGLAEIPGAVLGIMREFQVGCHNRREVVVKSGADTEKPFINLVKVHSGELNAGLVALRVQCGRRRVP
jgi:hypothetical protein